MENKYELRSKGRKSYRADESQAEQSPKDKSEVSEEDNVLENCSSNGEDSEYNSNVSNLSVDEGIKRNQSHSQPGPATDYTMYKITLIVVFGALMGLYLCQEDINYSMEELKSKYSTQKIDMWQSMETGVMEVMKFNKPSVFIYLYNKQSEEFIDTFINDIAQYASNILNAGNALPAIHLSSEDLNTTEAITDYGYIINKYKQDLEKKSVMVVKNIDKVPAKVAQSFHSFCDEYTPLVGKSLFIFTMKIKDSSVSNYKLVDSILRENWKDLDQDIYEPLFTRISSMILRIQD